jgi:hypothetical protein
VCGGASFGGVRLELPCFSKRYFEISSSGGVRCSEISCYCRQRITVRALARARRQTVDFHYVLQGNFLRTWRIPPPCRRAMSRRHWPSIYSAQRATNRWNKNIAARIVGAAHVYVCHSRPANPPFCCFRSNVFVMSGRNGKSLRPKNEWT